MSDFVFPQDGTTPDILGHYPREGGLTKRELFAAAALSNPDITLCAKNGLAGLGRVCCDVADALLEALNANPRKD